MSLKATNKENSPLLNNNTNYQAYNDEMKQSQSISKSSKSSLLSNSNSNHIMNDKNKKNPSKSKSKSNSKRVNVKNKRSRAKSRTNAIPSIRIDSRNNRSDRNTQRRNNNDNQINIENGGRGIGINDNDTQCDKCLGKLFFFLDEKGCIKNTQILYAAVLLIAGAVAICLVLSRIFNNKIFNSNIFKSNSAPLLLAANIVMMISYGIEDFLALRICLSCGCLLFALWGLFNNPLLLDTTMFNTVMFLLNVRHAMKLWYKQRYIAFEPQYEKIYQNVFKGYLNRVDFQKLAKESYIRSAKKDEIFKRKDDEVTSLCCLVKGKISVVREVEFEPVSMIRKNQKLTKVKSFNNSHLKYKYTYDYSDDNIRRGHHGGGGGGGRSGSTQSNKTNKTSMMHSLIDDKDDSDIEHFLRNPHFVNLCHKNQFIEAPQWVHANLKPDGDRFTVSFVAVEECEYIKWPKETLITLIEANPAIYHALNGVLGLHTARALLKSRKYTKIQDDLRSDNNSMTRYKANLSRKNTLNNDADIDEDEQDCDQEEEEEEDDDDDDDDDHQTIDDEDEDDNDDNDI